MIKINTSRQRKESGNNYEKRLSDDIEELKLGKISSQTEKEDTHKISDKRYQIDNYDQRKYDERYQMGEMKADEINFEAL